MLELAREHGRAIWRYPFVGEQIISRRLAPPCRPRMNMNKQVMPKRSVRPVKYDSKVCCRHGRVLHAPESLALRSDIQARGEGRSRYTRFRSPRILEHSSGCYVRARSLFPLQLACRRW